MGEERTIEVDLPPGLPLVYGNAGRTRQVLSDLVENAVKYSRNGSRILVIVAYTTGSPLREISDEGLGIPSTSRKTVFRKVLPARSHDRRGVTAAVSGLYICRELRAFHEMGGSSSSRALAGVRIPAGRAPGRRRSRRPHRGSRRAPDRSGGQAGEDRPGAAPAPGAAGYGGAGSTSSRGCSPSSASLPFTMFLENGMPVRATLSCTFLEVVPQAQVRVAELHSADVRAPRHVARADTLGDRRPGVRGPLAVAGDRARRRQREPAAAPPGRCLRHPPPSEPVRGDPIHGACRLRHRDERDGGAAAGLHDVRALTVEEPSTSRRGSPSSCRTGTRRAAGHLIRRVAVPVGGAVAISLRLHRRAATRGDSGDHEPRAGLQRREPARSDTVGGYGHGHRFARTRRSAASWR